MRRNNVNRHQRVMIPISSNCLATLIALFLALASSRPSAIEIEALKALYNGMNGRNWVIPENSQNGKRWSFAKGSDPCAQRWVGITCTDTKQNIQIISLGGHDDVRIDSTIPSAIGMLSALTALGTLNLLRASLQGQIPSTIGLLTSLTVLSLIGNNLSGTIPELGRLRNLQQLYLDENFITGTLPASIGDIKSLTILSFTKNSLSGNIPRELGRLQKLQELYLDQNRLTSSIPPALMLLTKLSNLFLRNNMLDGALPSNIGSCVGLIKLRADNNQLTGSLPSSLGRLSSLRQLDLSDNSLEGSLPSQIGQLKGLTALSLGRNRFNGTLPYLGGLPLLQQLFIDGNKLTGSIPSSLGLLTDLTYLSLNLNSFSGLLPPELGSLAALITLGLEGSEGNIRMSGTIPHSFAALLSLQSLDLGHNAFVGYLPSFIGGFKNLTSLKMHANSFIGSIPSSYASLLQLQSLYLYDNSLDGSLPAFLGQMADLEQLFLFNNKFHSSLPEALGELRRLQYFWCFDNTLTGSVPSTFRGLTSLISIQLSNNSFSGAIETWVGQWPSLVVLFLSTNQFISTIPATLASLSSLQLLSLQENRFTGPLPHELSALSNVTLFNVSVNSLQGPLPATYGRLINLKYFDCSFNRLSGSLPDTYSRMSSLIYFFADSNRLKGAIPEAWGTLGGLQSMQQLRLRNNLLTGTIPQLGALMNMTKLYLSNNTLSSSIPPELASLTNLVDLFLDRNLLQGTFPSILCSFLTRLSKLRVGHNRISGTLPSALYQLTNLASLQIQYNAFSGSLPSSISQLQALRRFHISYNLFSGSLPSGLGSISSLAFISVAANRMTGTLPTQLSSLEGLSYLDVHGNNFVSGVEDLEWINAQTMPSLRYIDVSANNFSGSVPAALFTIPSLRSVILAENCFRGKLPATLCQATSLQDLVLDGLAAGRGCLRPLWSSSNLLGFNATLAGTLTGSMPHCLWRLPMLRQLHIAGNGLSGSIDPALTHWPANLTDLSLANNRLSQPIPQALQQQAAQFDKLDIGYNKFNGTLSTFQLPSSLLCLDVNRLSGWTPASLYPQRTMHYRILAGNFFDCSDPQRDFSPQDPYLDAYQCGSSTMNYYMETFAALLVVAAAGAWVRRGGPGSFWIKWDVAALLGRAPQPMPRTHAFVASGERVKRALVIVLAVLVLLLLPVFGALSVSSRSHTYSYIWTVSAAFKTGGFAAALMIFVSSVAGLTVFVLSLSQAAVVMQPGRGLAPCFGIPRESVPDRRASLNRGPDVTPGTWSGQGVLGVLILRLTVIFTINAAAAIGANLAFVYIIRSATARQKNAAEFALSVFNWLWELVLAELLKSKFLFFGLQDQDILHAVARTPAIAYWREKEGFSALLSIVSQIIAPLLSSMAVDPNCFLSLFYRGQPITSTYQDMHMFSESLDSLQEIFDPTEKVSYSIPTNYTRFVTDVVTNSLSFTAPFQYLYQCSSTIVVSYAPVMLNGAILRAFGEPLKQLVARALLSRMAAPNPPTSPMGCSYIYLLKLLPRITWTRAEREAALHRAIDDHEDDAKQGQAPDTRHAPRDAQHLVDRSKLYAAIVNDVAILGSFGVMCPLLGLAVGVGIYVQVAMMNSQIGAFVRSAGSPLGAKPEELTQLELDCTFDGEGSALFHSRWMVLSISLCFFAFFAFDVAGDEAGAVGAAWAPVVQVLVPLILAGLLELCYRSGLLVVSTKGQPGLSSSLSLELASAHHGEKLEGTYLSELPGVSGQHASLVPDQHRWIAKEWEVGRASLVSARGSLGSAGRLPVKL